MQRSTSRVLVYPDAPAQPQSQASSSTSSSYKAPFRPGKIPYGSASRPAVKRNDSVASLPSPPSESSGPLQPAFISSLLANHGAENGDLSATDEEEEGDGDCDDGMQVDLDSNLNRNGEDPFRRSDPFRGGGSVPRPVQPDHPQASPTQIARRRMVDKNRIQVERKEDVLGAKSLAKPRKLAALSSSDPFVDRPSDKGKGPWVPGQAKKPEKLSYVFRGKRIEYDMPVDVLLSAGPDESPEPELVPRLLFPPPPPVTPPSATPSASFLDSLRASITRKTTPVVEHGLPTPARERERKKPEPGNGGNRFDPYKRPLASVGEQ
ncbi:hypothetical protein T439DRAFT_326438 [Meredithblackwellia eburnea MCA 4105]